MADPGPNISLTQTSWSGIANPCGIITFCDNGTGIPKSIQRLRVSSLQPLAQTEIVSQRGGAMAAPSR